MDELNRNYRLLSSVSVDDNVPINPTLSRDEQFGSWLNDLPRQFCRRHKRTPLLLDRDESARAFLARTDSEIWHSRFMRGDVPEPMEREKFYPFRAVLNCPACRVAYALCPPEFHETSFDTFDTSTSERAATLASAREFAEQVNHNSCGFALFVGPTGPGKTRLACNIIRALENRDSLYVRQGGLTCALRSTYGRKDVNLHRSQRSYDDEEDEDDPPQPLEIVQKVHFLVLDEIGCTPLANDERLLLDELLKHRYEQRKPTILISNLPLTGTQAAPGVREYLGDALTDRIREATGNGKFIVQFSGESYRRTMGENYLGGLA